MNSVKLPLTIEMESHVCVLGRHTIEGMQFLTCALLVIEAFKMTC